MRRVAKDNDIDTAAAVWAVRLDRGELTPAEQEELQAWLQADSRHVGALARARAIWLDLDRIAAFDPAAMTLPPRRRWWEAPRALLAACVATVLAIGALGGFMAHFYLLGREAADLGEVRRIALEDGSVIMLNTSSVVQVRYQDDVRRVVLREGEASFDVAHDDERPFIVQARDVSVKAIGTSFTVRLQPTTVAVTVAEGVVEVVREANVTTPAERRIVGRSRQIVAMAEKPLIAHVLTEAELSRTLSWQDGLLVFEGERLARAAAEVNRYSPIKVIVEDDELASQSFVGVFRIGDARAFAYAAAAAFDATVREEPGALYVSAR